MTTDPVRLELDEERLVQALQEAGEKLDLGHGEVLLDFSSVHRIDPSALRAMEQIADKGDGKGTRVVLRGVNVEIYKVLKLMKLAPRFAFRT